MRKLLLAFLILLAVISIFDEPTITAYADTGPKPTLDIEVIGLEGPYYVDLLRDKPVNTTFSDIIYSELNAEFVEYADALREYRNADTNYFWYLDGVMPTTQGENLGLTDAEKVHFGYMVPTVFRIVIIKENKDIIVTNEVTRTQFYSNMVLDLTSNLNLSEGETNVYEFTGDVIEVGAVKERALDFLFRLLITLAVELLLAIFVFRLTKKQAIKVIIVINLITQILLNIIILDLSLPVLNVVQFYSRTFLFLEIAIMSFEMLAYIHLIKDYSLKRLVGYAIIANLITTFLTFIV